MKITVFEATGVLMTRVVRGVSLLFSGLFAGFLLCVLVLTRRPTGPACVIAGRSRI